MLSPTDTLGQPPSPEIYRQLLREKIEERQEAIKKTREIIQTLDKDLDELYKLLKRPL